MYYLPPVIEQRYLVGHPEAQITHLSLALGNYSGFDRPGHQLSFEALLEFQWPSVLVLRDTAGLTYLGTSQER